MTPQPTVAQCRLWVSTIEEEIEALKALGPGQPDAVRQLHAWRKHLARTQRKLRAAEKRAQEAA